jgi:hypothetical protein
MNATQVLTAAHCVVRLGGEPAPAVTVVAGTSNARDARQGQRITAASVRAHPYSQNGLGVDDVAVVTLQRPLNLSGASARAIKLVRPGSGPQPGRRVTAMGYGQQSTAADANGLLYSLQHKLADPYRGINSSCSNAGSDAAVRLCPVARSGAICFGDSGGPLVAGSPPVLVGIASRGTGAPPNAPDAERCQARKASAFVNLAAPEIRAFINGSSPPPLAPRLDGLVFIASRGSFRRPKLACDSDPWLNHPTLKYRWRDARKRKTLRRGKTYKLHRSDKGRRLVCEVTARNAGGTTTYRTSPRRITRFTIPPKRR